MNLWGRNRSWALILSGLIFFACEDPNEIGAELNPNSDNLTTLFREFTLPSTVILSDSVVTSSPLNGPMVGVYDDPTFGKTKVIAYTQLGVFQGIGPQDPVPNGAILDSADLVIHYRSFFGDNFTEPQRLRIHTLEDTLFRNVDYKSTIKTAISRDPVADIEFRATPGFDSVLIIRLNEDFGQKLLTLANENFLVGDTQPEFQDNVVPGIAFVPADDNDFIFGIEDVVQSTDSLKIEESSAIRVSYHLESDTTRGLFFDYTINGRVKYMTVDTDRSSSVLSGLQVSFEEYLPTTNQRYVQPLTGVNTKVDMSEIWDFIDSLDGFIINKAEFEISGVIDAGGSEDFVTTVGKISLLFTDDRNQVNGRVIFQESNIGAVVLNDGAYNSTLRDPLRINYSPDEFLYRGEISNYLQAAADSALSRTDLMIYPLVDDFNVRDAINPIDQLIFDADKIKLRLFYSTIRKL